MSSIFFNAEHVRLGIIWQIVPNYKISYIIHTCYSIWSQVFEEFHRSNSSHKIILTKKDYSFFINTFNLLFIGNMELFLNIISYVQANIFFYLCHRLNNMGPSSS